MRDRTRVQIAETKIRRVVHQSAVLKPQSDVAYHRDREVSSSAINEGAHGLPLRAQHTPTIIRGVKYQSATLCKNVGAHPQSARRGQVEYQAAGRLMYVCLDSRKPSGCGKQLTVAVPTVSRLGAQPAIDVIAISSQDTT